MAKPKGGQRARRGNDYAFRRQQKRAGEKSNGVAEASAINRLSAEYEKKDPYDDGDSEVILPGEFDLGRY
jgi:hypothetical protein